MQRFVRGLGALAVVAVFLPVSVEAQVLDFEGLQDLEEVANFYNGGTGGNGSSGAPNYGIQFAQGALALIDGDDGGSGNFENNPSGSTIAFFLNQSQMYMNVAAGFSTGFSFFYSSSQAASVNVWSGLNGTGVLLASLNLNANFQNNCPAYGPGRSGGFCNWDAVGVGFAGVAMSVDFGGVANQVGFDLITLQSSTPGHPVPEPASSLLILAGLTGMLFRKRDLGESV